MNWCDVSWGYDTGQVRLCTTHGTRTPDDLCVWLYTSYGPTTAKLPMMSGMND